MTKKATLWTWEFVLLLCITLFNGVAGMMTIPLVTEFAMTIGADLTMASTVSGLMSIVSMVVCPIAGFLADRISRKKILVFANLGYGLGFILHAFCTNLVSLFIVRSFTGIFFGVTNVVNIAYSANYISRERMGEGLGYVSLASIVAQAMGPSIGIWLLDSSGYAMTFIGAGLSAIVTMTIVLIMPDKEGKKDLSQAKKIVLKDLFALEFTGFMLMAVLFSSANGLVSTYIKLIARERNIENIALFFTVYSASMVVLRPLTGKLMDKKGVFIILIPAFFFAAFGMTCIGIGQSLGMMLAAGLFKALGQGSGTPSLQAYCVKTLDKSRAGVASSTILIGQSIGNAVSPIVGSFVVKSSGYEVLFLGAGAIVLSGGLILLMIQRTLDKKKQLRAAP